MEGKPENTGQWKPGQSGNPNGRPRNAPIVAPAVRMLLEMPVEDLAKFRPKTVAELAALNQVKRMIAEDDLRRFEALTNRIEGEPESKTTVGADESLLELVKSVNAEKHADD